MDSMKYRRILLKLSGEMLMGEKAFGLSTPALDYMAQEINSLIELKVQTAIVIGGGNIFRGMEIAKNGIERTTADYMGMLATVMNALALQDALGKKGISVRVMSGLQVHGVVEPYIQRRAVSLLEKNNVVIFAAGTGNPFFTTDTAAALRAMEIGADIIFKATKVDGVYSEDPVKNPSAVKYDRISYTDVLDKGLSVMDLTAITLCKDNNIPIVVFKLDNQGSIKRAVLGESVGTVVGSF
ncbi:MAG: UMP kinase [Nitrospirae bacterium]|nr:UMP kinase [Nitrospirota bacterium]